MHTKRLALILVLFISACVKREGTPTAEVGHVTATPDLVIRSTPASLEQYTIDSLRSRSYGGGEVEVLETLEETSTFTRYLIRYPSDGLTIYGFANVPRGQGPFPVIVAIHGYVDPAQYETVDYTAPALDRIAQNGFIVVHPDLRGYGESDPGDNLFRVGMAVDVLNLIALIRSQAGPQELFSKATDRLGLWGHSLGGNIALRVLTVLPDIDAAVLYAPLSGDEHKNAGLLAHGSTDPALQTELAASAADLEHISPIHYYADIASPIQLHHGTADTIVPVAWAEETCQALRSAGKRVECIYYPEEDHTFRRRVAPAFYLSLIGFYKSHLSR